MDIRNNKSAVEECVDHVSSLFVNHNSVEVPIHFRYFDRVGITGEFPNPTELNLEFADD